MSDVDLTTVKELLTRNDIKMTLRYAHLAPAHKRKAVIMLDSLLNPSPNCTTTAQETKKESAFSANSFINMVGDAGFEPATPAV